MTGTRIPLKDRFWSKVDRRGPDECWPWTARTTSGPMGYGSLRKDGHGPHVYAHRLSWELHNGPVPDGHFILHSCDNPKCCNPAHLKVGTLQDNHSDMMQKGRHGFGHHVGQTHPCAKLTEAQVLEIRSSPVGCHRLAKKYGVTPTTIKNIRNRKIWRHIDAVGTN